MPEIGQQPVRNIYRAVRNTAQSERAVYEPAQSKITLVGRPSLLIFPSDRAPDGGASSPLPLDRFGLPGQAGRVGKAESAGSAVASATTR